MKQTDLRAIAGEFLRYVVVGGLSFLVDAGVLALVKEWWFRENCTPTQMAVAVALGFVAGLTANYLLSSWFVFRTTAQREKSRRFSAFLVYAAVGVIGLLLTELGMWLGGLWLGNEGFWYLLTKCVVAGVVLVWNYAGRKIFVYRGE